MMLATSILIEAYKIMATAKAMAEIYDDNRSICKYVHSTSRGHEAIQIATGLHLQQHRNSQKSRADHPCIRG